MKHLRTWGLGVNLYAMVPGMMSGMTVLVALRTTSDYQDVILAADGMERLWDSSRREWIVSDRRAKKILNTGPQVWVGCAGISDYINAFVETLHGLTPAEAHSTIRQFRLPPTTSAGAEFGLKAIALMVRKTGPEISQWHIPRAKGRINGPTFVAYSLPKCFDSQERIEAFEKTFYSVHGTLRERAFACIANAHAICPKSVGRNAYAVWTQNGGIHEGWLKQ